MELIPINLLFRALERRNGLNISQVVVSGNVTLTTPALHTLLEAGIEVCFLSMYGQFRGRLSPPVAKNALIRCEQYRAHFDSQRALEVARACVTGKLESMRTMLMRANRTLQDVEITAATVAMQTMMQRYLALPQLVRCWGLRGMPPHPTSLSLANSCVAQ